MPVVRGSMQQSFNKAPLLLMQSLYSSVVERQSCKLKVLGSIPSGGLCFASGHGDEPKTIREGAGSSPPTAWGCLEAPHPPPPPLAVVWQVCLGKHRCDRGAVCRARRGPPERARIANTLLRAEAKCPSWASGRCIDCMWLTSMTLAGLEPAIFGSEDQRLIH